MPTDVPFARPITLARPAGSDPETDALLLACSTPGSAWLDVAGFILLMLFLELLAGAAMTLVLDTVPGLEAFDLDGTASELNRALLLPMLVIRSVTSIGVIAAILTYRRQSAESVGLDRSGLLGNVLIGVGATVVAYGVIMLSAVVLWLFWPALWDQMEENAERIMNMVPRLHPLGFAGVATMIGVYEELVFRGFLMTRLRRATGSWTVAVSVSTVVFTALHAVDQTKAALVSVAILSLVFSAVTIWRRSLVPAIVAHALFDSSQFIYLYFAAGDSWT